jgi:CheY-like chemotaxis protein
MIMILFFEDSPYDSENRLFRTLLRNELKKVGDIQIHESKTVTKFEELIRNDIYHIIILDVMAESSIRLLWTNTNEEVPSSLTGVELLRRCRLRKYGKHYINVPVYMRTARSESHVQRLCTREKATGFFRAGVDDHKLIEVIKKYCFGLKKILNK